mgnify:CR=1 FL=1
MRVAALLSVIAMLAAPAATAINRAALLSVIAIVSASAKVRNRIAALLSVTAMLAEADASKRYQLAMSSRLP